MVRRIMLAVICGLTCMAGLGGAPRVAAAIEIRCIESSKYKHLWQLFGNDRRKLAEFLQVGEAQLPQPETCRAVLVVGGIDPSAKSKEAGEANDYYKLLDTIEQSRGWLATLHLASPGGNITMGLQLGQLTRLFWLNTRAAGAKSFVYQPDFIDTAEPSADLVPGWRAYQQAVGNLAAVEVPTVSGRCASACTFIHVAGIDRRGTVYIHRGRRGNPGDPKRGVDINASMMDTLEGMHRAEARVIAFYGAMDSGERIATIFRTTPTATTVPATIDRTPRYIADLLRAKCGADIAQLHKRQETLRERIGTTTAEADGAADLIRLRSELNSVLVRRGNIERCMAASHERERLAQFAKYCSAGCDRRTIVGITSAKLRALDPPAATPPEPSPRRRN